MSRDLCFLSARELRRLIGAKKLSPVELVKASIARIEQIDPKVNAFTVTCFDRALEEARAAEKAVMSGAQLGLLHGMPIGVKDLSDTEGVRTTYGSRLYANNIPDKDDLQVAAARKSGAIILGKTNTPEFGSGATTDNLLWGATCNPFNPALHAGGSSGGSAVAVATGMTPLCTGNDFGASLRNPAAYCGIVGFRPSPGTVPYDKRPMAMSGMSVHGPLARDVQDAAMLLAGMVGDHTLDPYAQKGDPHAYLDIPRLDLSTLRVALSFGLGGSPVSEAIRKVFQRKMETIASHVLAAEWTEPELRDVHSAYEIYRGLHYFNRSLLYISGDPDKITDRFGELHPNVQDNFRRAESITAEQAAWSLEIQTKVFQAMAHHMKSYDVMITPVCAVSPFPTSTNYPTEIDGKRMDLYTTWTGTTYVVAMTLHPTVALPCGVDEAGMPFGIQVIGKYRDERRLLGIAMALEAAFEQIDDLKRPKVDIAYLVSQEDRKPRSV